jgi:hypothetical protein
MKRYHSTLFPALITLSALSASLATGRPVAAADKQTVAAGDTQRLPIDGSWVLKVILDGQSDESVVSIKGGELRIFGVKAYWKNIRRVPGSTARYSAVRVLPGLLWGTREDPVEFYLDADGILHHDDTQLAPASRSTGSITLRRP